MNTTLQPSLFLLFSTYVDGDPVRRLVLCAADLGDPPVGGDDEDGGEVGLEGAVQPERE